MPDSYCPRCDKKYTASTKLIANKDVEAHLKRQEDELHQDAYEQWIDDDSN